MSLDYVSAALRPNNWSRARPLPQVPQAWFRGLPGIGDQHDAAQLRDTLKWPVELLKTAPGTAKSGVSAPRPCSPASSNGTRLHAAVRGRHSGDGAGHHGYGRRACHLHRHPCHKELCTSTTSTAPTTAAQSPAWEPSPDASKPQPATKQPKSSPGADSDEDSS